MPSLRQLEEQGRALLADQKKLVEDDRRPWSLKRSEFDKLQADIDAVITQHSSLKALDQGLAGALLGAGSPDGPRSGRKALRVGDEPLMAPPRLVLDVQQTRNLYEAAKSGQTLRLEVKASTETSTEFPAAPQYVFPPLSQLREPTRVASLFPNVAASSSTVDYYRLTGAAAATTVAEGALKPQSDVSAALVSLAIRKIATWVAVTSEVLADFPAFTSVVDEDLTQAIVAAESDQLLNGNGTPPNMQGLLGTSGILTQTVTAGSQPLDALSTAITSLRTGASYTEPDAIVLNPTDLGAIRVRKDSNQRYLAGDPFEAGTTTLWGLPVVSTTAMPAGTAVVGNFGGGGVVYRREGLQIMSDAYSQLTNNIVRIVAEARLGLAITRPTNFVKLTGLNS